MSPTHPTNVQRPTGHWCLNILTIFTVNRKRGHFFKARNSRQSLLPNRNSRKSHRVKNEVNWKQRRRNSYVDDADDYAMIINSAWGRISIAVGHYCPKVWRGKNYVFRIQLEAGNDAYRVQAVSRGLWLRFFRFNFFWVHLFCNHSPHVMRLSVERATNRGGGRALGQHTTLLPFVAAKATICQLELSKYHKVSVYWRSGKRSLTALSQKLSSFENVFL